MVLGSHLIKRITSFLYDTFISRFLTITAHVLMVAHMTMLSGCFLDVGSGTGAPLQAIMHHLKRHYSSIVGVDMHHAYTLEAQKRFRDDKDVNIY